MRSFSALSNSALSLRLPHSTSIIADFDKPRSIGLSDFQNEDVAPTLLERPDRYSPLFSVDTRNGDVLWAIPLGPAAWRKLLDADVDTAAAMSGMLMLADIARGEKEMKDRDTLVAAAPEQDFRLGRHTQ